MAPPSRPSLTLKAAKALEAASEDLLTLEPGMEQSLAASKTNAVYGGLSKIIDTLAGVKDLCDVGKNTYPNYPRVRDTMIAAGEKIYKAKQEVEEIKSRFLMTSIQSTSEWRQIAIELADIASRLRAISFVPAKKAKEAIGD